MKLRYLFLTLLVVVLGGGGLIGWSQYRQIRSAYDAYQMLIQPGVTIAGLDVGWHSPEEAAAKIEKWVAEPYYRDFELAYPANSAPLRQDETLLLSPVDVLGFHIPVNEMVAEAMAASHQYDYWEGLKLWIQNQVIPLDLAIPLRMGYDESAAAGYLAKVASELDMPAIEPRVSIQEITFLPGQPGRKLDIQTSAVMINERVLHPDQREVTLAVSAVEPDQSRGRIESMLSTLVPVMERAPTPPSFYTATIPISTTLQTRQDSAGGLAGTPPVTYTGELTWTFPHFASYTGHLTTTYGFFFAPGQPGYRFDTDQAIQTVELALQAGLTGPITFDPDLVPPPPITPGLLIPPLEARLATFPGVTSVLLKNLDTGETIYDSNNNYVLSGMSLSKVGIMVELYRHHNGEIDAQTHQELVDMLGSESCNPCANRLLATIGGGSAHAGAQKVTDTMRRLGLANFYLCAPFRVVELWDAEPCAFGREGDTLVWTSLRHVSRTCPEGHRFGSGISAAAPGPPQCPSPREGTVSEPKGKRSPSMMVYSAANTDLRLLQGETPRFDPCVKATPREIAGLVEMIYQCSHDTGLLRDAYPSIFSPQVCQDMIDIMTLNDLRNMLGAGIPDETLLAHKHGFSGYDVPWGDTRAEVGIVFSPGVTYLISFYIWQDTPWINWGINQPLYRDVSNMIYNYFNPEEPFWPLPPWAPPPEEPSGEDAA